jgi:hypothetical protein
MVRRWHTRKSILLPICRLFTYPFAWTFALVALPFTAGKMISNECMVDKEKDRARKREREELKPPIPADV